MYFHCKACNNERSELELRKDDELCSACLKAVDPYKYDDKDTHLSLIDKFLSERA